MICQTCGNLVGIGANACGDCGNAVGSAMPQRPRAATAAPAAARSIRDVDDSDNDVELYQAVVGPKNQAYYLERFTRFDRAGKAGASWHWPAFFLTFYWFLYRKMWRNALIYFLLPYLLLVPLAIVAGMAGERGAMALGASYLLYLAAIFLLPPLYANALYYRHCREKIQTTARYGQSRERTLGELTGRGGTSNIVLFFVLIFVFVAVVGMLAAIAIPAYQDYTNRARVAAAAVYGQDASRAVDAYYAAHGRVPETLDEAVLTAPRPDAVKEISIDSRSGIISVFVAGGGLDGKSLQLVPAVIDQNALEWRCRSKDLRTNQLPRHCRE